MSVFLLLFIFLGVKIGVYTSQSQWPGIMGSYNGGSPYPLWYAHYISYLSLLPSRPSPPFPPLSSLPFPLPSELAVDPSYDGIQSFSDFAPFNGWSAPAAKVLAFNLFLFHFVYYLQFLLSPFSSVLFSSLLFSSLLFSFFLSQQFLGTQVVCGVSLDKDWHP